MNEDLIKAIWESHFKDKSSFDDFKNDIQNPDLQQAVWNTYFKDNASLDEFRADLGAPQATPQDEGYSFGAPVKTVTVVPAEPQVKPQNKPQGTPQGVAGQEVGGWEPVEKYNPDQALKDAIALDPGTPFAEKMRAMQQRDEQALNLLDVGMDMNDQMLEWHQQAKELDKEKNDISNTVPVSEIGVEDFNKRVGQYNQSVQETNTNRIGITRGLEELNKASEESKAFYLGTNQILKGFYQDVFNKEGGTSVFSQVVEPLFLKWLNDNPGVLRRESTTPNFDNADRVKLASQFISSQIEGLKASEDLKAQRKIDFLKQEMGRILSDHPEELAKLKRTEERKDNVTIQSDDGVLESAWKGSRQVVNAVENAIIDVGANIISTGKALNDAILGSVGYDVDATTLSDRVYDGITDFTDAYLRWITPDYFTEEGGFNYGSIPGLASNTLATMYLLGKTSQNFGAISGASKSLGLVASGTMFTVGDAIEQGKAAGLSDKQATYYALPSAILQGQLEGFFPEIPLLGLKNASRVAIEAAAKGAGTKEIAGVYLKEVFKHVPGELLQEIGQNWADRGAQAVTNAVTDKKFFELDPEAISKEDWNTAVITTLATLVYGGVGNINEAQKAAVLKEVYGEMEPEVFQAILDGEVLQGNLTKQKAQKMYNSFTQVKQQIAEDNAKEEKQLENEQVQAGQEQKSQQQDQQVSQGGQAAETGGGNSTVNGEQAQEKVAPTEAPPQAPTSQAETGQVTPESQGTPEQVSPQKGDAIITGQPVTLSFVKNPEKAPDMGSTFGQDVEPSGKYVAQNEGFVPEGWQQGTVTLNNPLVVDIKEDTQVQWKRDLSQKYEGKTGKELTDALQQEGYDGIITKNTDGTTGEIIVFNPDVSEQKANNESATVQQAVPATATGESGVQVPPQTEGTTEGATTTTPTETVTATEAVAQGDTAPGRVATEGAVNTGAEQAPVSSVPEQGNTNPVHHTVEIGGELIDLYRDDNGRLRRSDNGAVVDSPALEEAIAVREEQAATNKKLAPWRNGKLSIKNGIKQLLSPSWQRDIVEALLLHGKKFTNLDKYFGDERADIKKYKTGFVSDNGDQIDDYIETVAESAGVPASMVEDFLTDAIDKIAGGGRRAFVGGMIEKEASLSSVSLRDTTELGLNDQGEIVEIVDGHPISVESNPPAEERTQGQQVKTSFKFTTSEQRGIRRTVRRLLADPDLDPKLREQIQRDVDAGIYDKDTLTDAEVRTLADQYISAVGLDNAYASVMNDENVPLNVKVQVLNKTAYRLAEQGRILDAAIVFEQLASEGSQLGAALRQFHAGEEDTLLTKAGIRFHVAKNITQKLNQKFGSTNKTKKEVLDEASKLLQADRDIVDEIMGKVKKSGDDYIKSGLTKIKNALNKPNLGFAQTVKNRGRELADSNRELFEGVLEVVKGLVVKTGGELTDIKKKFVEFFSNDPDLAQAIPKPDQLFDDLADLDEFKEAVNKGVVESLLRQHFGGQSTKNLKQLLEDNGITGKDADAIIKSTKKAFADTLDVNNLQAFTKLGLGPKLRKAMLEKAALEGKISGDDLLKYFAKQFGIPVLEAKDLEVLEGYGQQLEDAIAQGGGYKAKDIERKMHEILRRAGVTDAVFAGQLMADIFYANILSGYSTLMRGYWGAGLSNILGEVIPEVVRGKFEGRSKRLGKKGLLAGDSWVIDAAKNMFSPIGFAAGYQAMKEIMKHGSISISWADNIDLSNPSALDIFMNEKFSNYFKRIEKEGFGSTAGRYAKGIAKSALRGYMWAPVMMTRLLYAEDAYMKSGLTEFYAYVEAYNKAITNDGKLAGVELQNEINRLLGTPKLEMIKKEVNEEIANGVTAPDQRNLRMRQKLDEYRDEDVSNAAKTRALDALMIGDTYGYIPANIRRALTVGRITEKDPLLTVLMKTAFTYSFPIVRVPINAAKKMYDFSPLALVEGGLSYVAHSVFGETETAVNKMFNQRAVFSTEKGYHKEMRSVEERKRMLWRGAMGTVYGMMMIGALELLKKFDDPEKDDFFRINGPGTGDYRTNLELFGQDYKPMTLQIGNATIDYSDTAMGLGMAVLGYYMDILKSPIYAKGDKDRGVKKHEMVFSDIVGTMTMGMWNTTFQYSMGQSWNLLAFFAEAPTTIGRGVEKRTVSRAQRALELLNLQPALKGASVLGFVDKDNIGGATPMNEVEKDFVKTVGTKVSGQLYANFYKQSVRSFRAMMNQPVYYGKSFTDEIVRYTPYIESHMREIYTDPFGNPIPERFDPGIPFLSPVYVQELFHGKYDDKNEYVKVVEEVPFEEPDFWLKVGSYHDVSLPRYVAEPMFKEVFKRFATEVVNRKDELKDMDTKSRQDEIDDMASSIVKEVRTETFENEAGFPYTIYSIDKTILDENPSEYDLQIASENLERIKDQLDKYQYRDRKDKLAKLKKDGEL